MMMVEVVLFPFFKFLELSKTRGVEMYHTVEWPVRG